MKRIVLAALLSLFTVLGFGCTSWWQQLSQNPLAYVQSFEAGVQVFLTSSDTAVADILPYLGDKGPALENAYEDAKNGVAHAESALNDLVQAAIDIKNNNPDFSQAISDVLAAVDQVIAAVDAIRNAPVPASAAATISPATAYNDLQHERLSLERYRR